MSNKFAIIAASGEIVAINVQADDYVPAPYEVEVTGAAWVGGDYVSGMFYPPQPFPSWTRSEGEWLPPIPMPTNGGPHNWNEDTQEWQSTTQ